MTCISATISAKVLKVVSNGCLGNIKALILKYVSHWIFFLHDFDKIFRNWIAEELRRNPCKRHVSWLLIDLECCFFFWNQMIVKTVIGIK